MNITAVFAATVAALLTATARTDTGSSSCCGTVITANQSSSINLTKWHPDNSACPGFAVFGQSGASDRVCISFKKPEDLQQLGIVLPTLTLKNLISPCSADDVVTVDAKGRRECHKRWWSDTALNPGKAIVYTPLMQSLDSMDNTVNQPAARRMALALQRYIYLTIRKYYRRTITESLNTLAIDMFNDVLRHSRDLAPPITTPVPQ